MCPFSPSITASRFQADLGKLAMTSLTMRAFGAPSPTRGASLGRPPVCSAGPSTSGRWVHTRVLAETESRVEAAMGLDRFPQPRRVPVDFISRHPSHRHPLRAIHGAAWPWLAPAWWQSRYPPARAPLLAGSDQRPMLPAGRVLGPGTREHLCSASLKTVATWLFSRLPAVPLYCRATPTECVPFFRKPVSSTIP